MADIAKYFPKLLVFEGGEVNDPTDKGGATKMGVTLSTFQKCGYDKDGDGDIDINDLHLMVAGDAMAICKKFYWDKWQADQIKNQSIAEQLVEWVWGSGKWGIVIPQKLIGVTADGIVGNGTLMAINGADQQALHEKIRLAKVSFINDIVNRSVIDYKGKNVNWSELDLLKYTQKRFLNGWLHRINSFEFEP